MKLSGRIIAVLPERSGMSARGEWKVQSFVVETHEQYPHKMVFSVFGAERLQRFNIKANDEVTVFFDIDAHENQGRWFNDIRAFDVRKLDAAAADPQTTQAAPAPFPPAQPDAAGESTDDLPF